jgi:hypothetical protein
MTAPMPRKKLPIGIQTFREIREENYYYVDKTGFARRLIDEGKYYFLSRPRRFGKSLLVDTLAELFQGNEPLFRGLAIHDSWDWSRHYPVIRISFGSGRLASAAALDERIREILADNQANLGVSCTHPSIPGCFGELIRQAHAQYGQRAVVLVDEYDKPILDNLTEPEVARAMREGLRNLYSVIKGEDAAIRFALLTGVSKFSRVSLFSGLNNLRDITVSQAYSAICGYTQADVDRVFWPELDGLDREEVQVWYNGYHWTGEAVYNPFDLLLLFQERIFKAYWFETGTPTFLIDILTERQVYLPRLGQTLASEALLSAFDVDHIATEALLWQTGYLSIDRVERFFDEQRYYLRYPNREVYQALANSLLLTWSGAEPDHTQQTLQQKYRLGELLLANDFAGMQDLFTAFFASIPHDWYRNTPLARYEGYYASVFYAYFAALGLDLIPEDSSRLGRLDLAVRLNGQVYLFEFKVVELEPEGGALAQIKARGYADKYRAEGLPVHLIGVEFSRAQRTVVGFEVESV